MRGARALPAVLAGVLALAGGCSALVSSSARVRCQLGDDGTDPCPGAQTCRDGVCVTPGTAEDGGTADGGGTGGDGGPRTDALPCEGPDEDGDGAFPCGSPPDCDDTDPDVHPAVDGPDEERPAAREACDGKDNDCDDVVDEGAQCEDGWQCHEAVCVEPTCPECGPEERCDIGSAMCVSRAPDGEPCQDHDECMSGSCMPPLAFGLDGGICSQACCADSDCEDGFVCWPSGTGARACIPQDLVPVVRGPAPPNAECTMNAECQSGICLGPGIGCLGNCQDNTPCGAGRECAPTPFSRPNEPSIVAVVCRDPTGTGASGSTCGGDDECRSGRCIEVEDGIARSFFCSRACRTSADCPDDVTVLSEDTYCGIEADDPVAICRFKDHDGNGLQGDPCMSDGECRDRFCHQQQVCIQACCHDRDCPEDTHCRPQQRGSAWGMYCVP